MKAFVLIGCLLLLCLHMFAPVCCDVIVKNITITPQEAIVGESANMKCQAIGYDPTVHQLKWQRQFEDKTMADLTTGGKVVIDPVIRVSQSVYNQTITITNLLKADEGLYLCLIVTGSGSGRHTVTHGQGHLYVSYAYEFPVCSPSGPAVLTAGESLSCKTVIDERLPVVALKGVPNVTREGWFMQNDTELGSELRKIVTVEDEDLAYECFSLSSDKNKILSCTIGPLTVIEQTSNPTATSAAPPLTTALPLAAIIGIAVGGSILLLLLILTICCCCNPKRRCGSSAGKDEAETGMEMDRNNLGIAESSGQNGTLGHQQRSSPDGGDDVDNPPIPALEPNIYVSHAVAGPSTSRFQPDPSENWHEIDLKMEINEALQDDDSNYSN